MTSLPRPCVCVVTDRRRLAPDARTLHDELAALEHQLDAVIEAGADLIQLRERDLEAGVLRVLAERVVSKAGSATRVVVNDRADVAIAARAHGVHVRSDGPPARRVRELAPSRWIVGRSVHSVAEAIEASDADYLIFGTVFPSASKGVHAPVAGPDGLRAAAAASLVPVLAIGGVTLANVTACRDAGASGIAAIGLFLERPAAATRAIKELWIPRT